jgi:tetratricopeptide (TPR) repeat protein
VAPLVLLIVTLSWGDLKREAESLLQRNPADDRAGELLEQAVAADPNDAEAHYLLGRWALVKRHFERAVETETRAAQLSPKIPVAQMQAWTIVAVAEDQMNEPDKADETFRRAMAINRRLPHLDPNAAYEYLKVLETGHRDGEARALTLEILKASPDYGPAHLSKAKWLAAENKSTEAVKEAEYALTRLEGNRAVERDAHYLLARLYLRLKQSGQAEPHKRWLSENR